MATAPTKTAPTKKAPSKTTPAKSAGAPNGTTAATIERPGPDFSLRRVGAELLPEPVSRRGGGRHGQLLENLAAIQAEPGDWFEVVHYAARNGSENKPSGARKIVGQIMAGDIAMPEGEGEYEVEWRSAGYDGSERVGSVVVARFTPPLADTGEGVAEGIEEDAIE